MLMFGFVAFMRNRVGHYANLIHYKYYVLCVWGIQTYLGCSHMTSIEATKRALTAGK